MALSYTQNMEDYHLALAFAGRASGTYIDIGAGHPVADNVSFWFYQRGWRGVVVEPQDDLLALYERLRPRDLRVGALVGGIEGEADFHLVDRLHGLSSMRREAAVAADGLSVGCRTVTRPVTTLARLCETLALDAVDFLKIDVEGAEAEVVAGGDWRRFRPKVVVVEAVAPLTGAPAWADWEPVLLANDYRFVLFDTLNRFYVAAEAADVLARLPSERAPWDAVTHMYEIGRAGEDAHHPDHALARRLARGLWAHLPFLDRDLLAELLRRGARAGEVETPDLASEAFAAALGRIACGYDGGQVTAA